MIALCPECDSDAIRDIWVTGRKLQRSCRDCSWKEAPRTPKKQKVTGKKQLRIDNFSGWQYESFDRYGHISTVSRVYPSEAAALVDIDKELACGLKAGNPAGPYTVVLYNVPSSVTIQGRIIKKSN